MECKFQFLNSEQLKQAWIESFKSEQIIRKIEYFDLCLQQNLEGQRVTLIAFENDTIVGVAHLIYKSEYSYFNEHSIPEINDLNVFPAFRSRGIATLMLNELEQIAAEKHNYIGIGVGLYPSYGAAQRLYCKCGYIPDGNGICYENIVVQPGSNVVVDDDLVLYFTKALK